MCDAYAKVASDVPEYADRRSSHASLPRHYGQCIPRRSVRRVHRGLIFGECDHRFYRGPVVRIE